MKQGFTRLLTAAAAAVVVLAAPAIGMAQGTASANVAPSAQMAPDALIRSLSHDLLNTIRADKELQAGNIEKINKVVDEKVLPYVDFEKMTRLTVGRGWRQASADQRKALVREFRLLLTYTYSGAVSQITDHKVEMRPFRAAPGDNDVIVRTHVVASRGEPIQLDYRMEKADAGWRIYDVNILGIWLVENYKNSFASEINANGVDGLIKSLTERNRELAKKA